MLASATGTNTPRRRSGSGRRADRDGDGDHDREHQAQRGEPGPPPPCDRHRVEHVSVGQEDDPVHRQRQPAQRDAEDDQGPERGRRGPAAQPHAEEDRRREQQEERDPALPRRQVSAMRRPRTVRRQHRPAVERDPVAWAHPFGQRRARRRDPAAPGTPGTPRSCVRRPRSRIWVGTAQSPAAAPHRVRGPQPKVRRRSPPRLVPRGLAQRCVRAMHASGGGERYRGRRA